MYSEIDVFQECSPFAVMDDHVMREPVVIYGNALLRLSRGRDFENKFNLPKYIGNS